MRRLVVGATEIASPELEVAASVWLDPGLGQAWSGGALPRAAVAHVPSALRREPLGTRDVAPVEVFTRDLTLAPAVSRPTASHLGSQTFGILDGAGRDVVDLTNLAAGDGFIIQGDAAGDYAGRSVSSAGDVNGDGIDDLIVGAFLGDDGGSFAGEAYVIFGTLAGFGADVGGRRVIDLTSLTAAQGFIIQGDTAYDGAGFSVSSAGDVNGDGIDDLIVGARDGDDGGSFAGEAYVVFGTRGGFGTAVGGRQVIDLTSLTPAQGFIIQGDKADDRTGYAVSSAGDVNGDGFDDLIIGASGYAFGPNPAQTYVVFGSPNGFGTLVGGRRVLDLTTLSAAQGFIIPSESQRDGAGKSVSAAGDVNGDGIDDLIVGAPNGSDGGLYAGEAYVVFGRTTGFGVDVAGRQVFSLGIFFPSQGFIIQGDAAGDYAGASVSSAGDVNGDGIDDLIVGARRGDDGGPNAGEAYVVFGSLSGFGVPVSTSGFPRQVLDLTTLTAAQGFIIQGAAGSGLGGSVSAAGDVNGDGIDDLIVGARYGASSAGESYVIFGTRMGFGTDVNGRQVLDVTSLPASQGFVVQGDTTGDFAGVSVSAAGDVDGDGINDVIVGATGGDDGGDVAGEAYVIFGIPAEIDDPFPLVVDLTTLSATDGFIIQGDAAYDWAGWSVSNAGDVNGDGIDDLIIGARQGDDGGNYAGEAYVIFGRNGGFGTAVGDRRVIDLTSLNGANGFIIQGDTADDLAGWSVSNAGDVNGDGIEDLIVGAPRGDDGGSLAGEAYVVFGTRDPFGSPIVTGPNIRRVIDLTTLTAAQGFIIQGHATADQAGFSVSNAGDVNGDGIDDLIVGAPGGSDDPSYAGEAYVVFGSRAGFGFDVGGRRVLDLSTLTSAQGFTIRGDAANDGAGVSVSNAGDVNGDGIDDLIVGAQLGGAIRAGEAYVVFGTRSTFGTIVDLGNLPEAQGFIIRGNAAIDLAGSSVSSAGDVNGDGIDDLIVGAPNGNDGGADAGEAYVVFGSRDGFGTEIGGQRVLDLTTLTSAQGFIIQGDAAGDLLGVSVSHAGDVNGDGIDDLIVGASSGDDGGNYAGEAYVIFGSRAGFGTDVGGRRVLDLTDLTDAQGFIVQGDAAGDTAGRNVSAAGDVNGDGLDDLIVGAFAGDDGGNNAGEAYVIFGRRVGANNDLVSTLEDMPVTISILDNDPHDRGLASIARINDTAASVGVPVTLPSGATATLNADGTITYDPNGRFGYLITAEKAFVTGAVNVAVPDSFTYTLDGSSTATVIVTLNGIDSADDQLRGDLDPNTITGTAAADLINLNQGEDDIAFGGAGDDGFYFGSAYTSADAVDGGEGTLDQLGLQGDYSNGVTLGSLVDTELVVLLPGNDARFDGQTGTDLSYNITTIDANAAAGQVLIFQANTLRADEDFTLDGSAETDGSLLTFGGLGTETITGGQADDGFYFGTGRFNPGDTLNGGGGSDQLGLQGNFAGANALVFGASQLTGIAFIVPLSASDTRFGGANAGQSFSYGLTMNNGNVAAGQQMIISANTLQAGETLTFNGAAETDGSFRIFSGAGSDTIAGSQHGDIIFGGAGADSISGQGGADQLTGGAGNDVFRYFQANDSTAAARDSILDFRTGDTINLTGLAANSGGGNFTFIGGGAQTGARQLQVIQSGNQATVNVFIGGDANADLVINVTVADGHTLTVADFSGGAGQAPLSRKLVQDEFDLAGFGNSDGEAAGSYAQAKSPLFDSMAGEPVSLPDIVTIEPFSATSDFNL